MQNSLVQKMDIQRAFLLRILHALGGGLKLALKNFLAVDAIIGYAFSSDNRR